MNVVHTLAIKKKGGRNVAKSDGISVTIRCNSSSFRTGNSISTWIHITINMKSLKFQSKPQVRKSLWLIQMLHACCYGWDKISAKMNFLWPSHMITWWINPVWYYKIELSSFQSSNSTIQANRMYKLLWSVNESDYISSISIILNR